MDGGDAWLLEPIIDRDDLRATDKPLCLPINFGRPKVEIRRITAQA